MQPILSYRIRVGRFTAPYGVPVSRDGMIYWFQTTDEEENDFPSRLSCLRGGRRPLSHSDRRQDACLLAWLSLIGVETLSNFFHLVVCHTPAGFTGSPELGVRTHRARAPCPSANP